MTVFSATLNILQQPTLWKNIEEELNNNGYSLIPQVLSHETCKLIIDQYTHEQHFRSTINMQRYRFGRGEYKYFKYPLPPVIQSLRETFYPQLAAIANRWMEQLETFVKYPTTHLEFLERCHAHGQIRPTPLLLQYNQGDFNTLHQDLYGEIYFPFQIAIVLTQPGVDYHGGELVLTAQTPRAQSKAIVIQPNCGDAIIFTTNFRPVQGSRGYYKSKMKHGVSEIRKGIRYSLGIIFHDAL